MMRLFLAALALSFVTPVHAQLDALDTGLIDQPDAPDEFDDLVEGKKDPDYERLRHSHLSYVSQWRFVKPERMPRKKKLEGPFHWQVRRGFASPTSRSEVTALFNVPEGGNYRVLLRHILDVEAKRPTVLTIQPVTRLSKSNEDTPVWQDSGTSAKHVFGNFELTKGATGKKLEETLPIRFESDHILLGPVLKPETAWEHWDSPLTKGVYRFSLQSDFKTPQLHALFITGSQEFRPSFSSDDNHRVFDRIYVRFRVHDTTEQPDAFSVSAGLTYHWRGRPQPGSTEPAWGWRVGSAREVPLDKWSPFIEATEAMVPGPGPWSTCGIGFGGLEDGEAEIEFAWYPHPGAVMHSVRTGIGSNRAMIRVPHGDGTAKTRPNEPTWGMWEKTFLDRVQTQGDIVKRYFEWARAAEQKLGISPEHPRPRRIHITTSCRVGTAYREQASEMLAMLGVNWIEGAPQKVIDKLGLFDETSAYHVSSGAALAKGKTPEERAKLTKVKVGDEITTYTDPERINGEPARRRAFHDYLRQQAAMLGMDIRQFLGVSNLDRIECIGAMPEDAGRFQRRLYYHSHRFCHLTTVPGYKRITEELHQYFPNVNVYNNYSPHPVFLTGTTMNHIDWFILARNKAQSLAWGEDWAWGSWNLGTREWCVSFYTALVECAARKHNYPSGFYVGSNTANSARKMFTSLAHGLTWLHLYDWGPIDGWAEGSNSWSERASEYYEVMAGACALGPADLIVAEGKRAPRRAAVLYNRSHEILNGGRGRLNHDWMWSFIGLKCAKIPTEVIIEEDLTAESLEGYDVLILGGFNLERRHLEAVQEWVKNGGLLIGGGGFAQRDVYNDLMPVTEQLFGCRQALLTKAEGTANASFSESEFYPGVTVKTAGEKFRLTPTTGTAIATFENGDCAAVAQDHGNGTAIQLGFQPGYTFRANGRSSAETMKWFETPVRRKLVRPDTDYTYRDCEVTRFEHESGIAILLTDFGRASKDGDILSVKTSRQITEVISGLRGPLEWKRNGDRIEVVTKALNPVDSVILR